MSNYYFMRVGSDSSQKVPFSMIIKNKLLFIPIGTTDLTSKKEIKEYSYEDLCNFNKPKSLMKYFGKVDTKKEFFNFHLDPFFNHNGKGEFSYGDRKLNENNKKITKAIALKNLIEKGVSYIIFLATVLKPTDKELDLFKSLSWKRVRSYQKKNMGKNLAIIGYFKIKEVKIYNHKNLDLREYIEKTYKYNSHVKRNDFERCKKNKKQELYFVLGDKKESKFLRDNPIVISESTKGGHYELTENAKKNYFSKRESLGYRCYGYFDDSTFNFNKLKRTVS